MAQAVGNLTVREKDGTSIVDIVGELNAFSEHILMDAFSKAGDQGARAMLLNFSGLDYMNSSGIGLLVTLLIRARRLNMHMMACGLSDHYRQIFELTRLNEAISVFPTETEALMAVSQTNMGAP